LLAVGWRRRRSRRDSDVYEPGGDVDDGYGAAFDEHWGRGDADLATEHLPVGDLHPPEHQPPSDAGSAARVSWGREAGPAVGPTDDVKPVEAYGDEALSESHVGAGDFEGPVGIEEEDPDAVDTDSIPVVSEDVLLDTGYPEVPEEAVDAEVPEEGDYADADHPQAEHADVAHEDAGDADARYPDVAVPRTPPVAAYLGVDAPDTAEPDAGYPDVAVPHAAADVAYPEDAVAEAHVEPTVVPYAVASSAEPRTGRHAAVDAEDDSEWALQADAAAHPGRPTIHLPLDDPYQVPDGYPIKASARFGLYYTPGSELYHDTLAEIWLSSEEVAQANGFIKAD
jgi:uncharacterized protein with LGFP repeats